MLNRLKIAIIFLAVVVVASTATKLCRHLISPPKVAMATASMMAANSDDSLSVNPGDYYMNDTIYEWDDKILDWIFVGLVNELDLTIDDNEPIGSMTEPIEINWNLLNNIKYRLRYFEALETGLLAPIFTQTLEELDGKQVTIKGFTIPFEDDYVSLALSANPLSSCFFCGKASPTSIISLQLKNEKRFKTDAIKRFTGTLHLNVDDPNQFYYILSDARLAK